MPVKPVILLLFVLLLLVMSPLEAAQRRMLGPEVNMSWVSSYLTVNSGSVTIQNNATWSYANACGWFLDYLLNPYVSMRTHWIFYPEMINSRPDEMFDHAGVISLHEIGISLIRHFGKGYVSPWFGAGPYIQFDTIDNINSYVFHATLSAGFDYECAEDVYFCPEIMFGIGAGFFKTGKGSVQVDVPTGPDFSTSGIVIFLKLGVAKAF
ncbi:MAG TPA: hypothetical protein PK514_06850 [Spirochaetota bacterium]|nr:hypothetical protein [Spirochaetota bacterium]